MKHLFFFTLFITSTSAVHAQANKVKEFSLVGKVIGQDTGYVHIGYFNSFKKYVSDSCYLKNGYFQFTGRINEPTVMSFYGKRKSRSVDDPNWTEFFAEPAKMEAVLTADEFKKAQIAGSVTQNEYTLYNRQVDILKEAWQQVFDKLDNAKKANDTTAIQAIYDDQMPVFRNETQRVGLNFIKQHPASCVSAYLLGYQTQQLPLDSLKQLYLLLTPAVKQSRYAININNFIAKAEKLEIGMPAPNFTQTDASGRQISLEKLRGNYVLLDFWASWCVPCREENPYLKQAYAKYHDKGFTIVGFSLDKPEDKNDWLNAIQKDDLPWTQVCDFKGWNGEVVNDYNLYGKGIPSNFLINTKGQIVAKDLRGDDVEQKLEELMK